MEFGVIRIQIARTHKVSAEILMSADIIPVTFRLVFTMNGTCSAENKLITATYNLKFI